MISYVEALRQLDELTLWVEQADETGDAQRAVDARRALLAHPCAHHEVDEDEVLAEIDRLEYGASPADTSRHVPDRPVVVELRPCAHCGFDPYEDRIEVEPEARQAVLMQLAVGWFSADEWSAALACWPELAEENPVDHREYSREIEARTEQIARHLVGHELSIAPLAVADLDIAAEEEDEDPGSAKARAAQAARVRERGGAYAWPPARNDPCWCGSGRKYKQCCGPVPAAPEPEAV
jgi:hypothetical protein